MKLSVICLALFGASLVHDVQAACYTVYRQSNAVYRSTTAPVDLSLPLGDTVPARFGAGASMVTSTDETGCSDVTLAAGPLPDGISRPEVSTKARRTAANAAAAKRASAAPASLDGVFLDQSLQMRSSVGVGPAASSVVQHVPLRK
jgi:hypothetical protein